MRFQKSVAILAIIGLAAQAQAQDGALRRMAQNDAAQPQVIVIPANSGQTTTIQTKTAPATQAVQQPTTVVEATPVTDSRADGLRKARQDAEVQTEQKIVEKLEESRLKEEQQRAERLFGNKIESTAPVQQQEQQPVVAPVVQPQPAQPVAQPQAQPEQKPTTQVTIEKVEIVQPVIQKEEPKEEKIETVAPVAESKAKLEDEEEAKPFTKKFYVGGILAAPQYSAGNVKTNHALGVSVGTMLSERIGVEASFLYSSYYIDTFWRPGLYSEMTQYDLQGAGKYYLLTGPLKPYIGGSLTYINRTYQNRVKDGIYWTNNSTTQSENTNAVNVGLLGGVDYEINSNFMVGAGIDYNRNVTNSRNNFTSAYNLQPEDTKALEEIDYYTFKLSLKLTF